jgi:hypothetical protein
LPNTPCSCHQRQGRTSLPSIGRAREAARIDGRSGVAFEGADGYTPMTWRCPARPFVRRNAKTTPPGAGQTKVVFLILFWTANSNIFGCDLGTRKIIVSHTATRARTLRRDCCGSGIQAANGRKDRPLRKAIAFVGMGLRRCVLGRGHRRNAKQAEGRR